MYYLLSFYAPDTHVEAIKDAIFSAGAGMLGPYQHCAWQTLGEGQFMPLAGSNAYVGTVNQLEKVSEYKVDIVCSAHQIEAAVAAMKQAHPYETPAYYVIKIETY